MDDYHEFQKDHATKIKEWRQNWSPSYVSITHGGVASGGTLHRLLLVQAHRLFPHLCLTLSQSSS
jgi:hypothetical protein